MTISLVCLSRRSPTPADVRSELPEPRRPTAAAPPAVLRRREGRERRRVLAELAALLERNPFLEP